MKVIRHDHPRRNRHIKVKNMAIGRYERANEINQKRLSVEGNAGYEDGSITGLVPSEV